MSTATVRFPRTAYARRIQRLATDLGEWIPGLREYADGPDATLNDPWRRARAEDRAYALYEIVRGLEQLATQVRHLR